MAVAPVGRKSLLGIVRSNWKVLTADSGRVITAKLRSSTLKPRALFPIFLYLCPPPLSLSRVLSFRVRIVER